MSDKPVPVRHQQWSERLDRFAQSGQTVGEFCKLEGVSKPTFYQWKQRLRGSTSQPEAIRSKSRQRQSANPTTPAFKPVWITTPEQTGVTIRLPDGIVMELGADLQAIEQVVGQLLDYHANRGADRC